MQPTDPDDIPGPGHPGAGRPQAAPAADPDPGLGRHQLQSLTLAPVQAVGVRALHTVDAATDVVSVVRLFRAERTTQVLVRGATGVHGVSGALGIFTTSGLQRAILQGTALQQLAVGTLASQPLVTVGLQTPVFDALALMIRHRVQRLVVLHAAADGSLPLAPAEADVAGVLEQLDLLSFLSNHSYLVTRQILDAGDLAALAAAAGQITRVIGLLHASGTRVGLIGGLVQALNARLFERAWQLIAPADLVAHSCLFVMGSEGRGEQLLKTDQDNALVLRDGYQPPADLAAICARFSQALADFGYPPCPGRIMLSNPAWCHPVAEFAQQARRWLLQPTPDSLVALAVFLDAHAVCGDATLLAQVRAAVWELVADNDVLLARFAAAVGAFDAAGDALQGSWWSRLLHPGAAAADAVLDLKRAGVFPLVHGVRALALAERLQATGTAERVAALVAAGRLPAQMGSELVQALHVFIQLKLDAGLAALAAGRSGDAIDLASLGTLDRERLKDTLAVVKRFKALLRLRFHLDAV
jgi:CBS domain-containing protein